jgi:hypothetical protein
MIVDAELKVRQRQLRGLLINRTAPCDLSHRTDRGLLGYGTV